MSLGVELNLATERCANIPGVVRRNEHGIPVEIWPIGALPPQRVEVCCERCYLVHMIGTEDFFFFSVH